MKDSSGKECPDRLNPCPVNCGRTDGCPQCNPILNCNKESKIAEDNTINCWDCDHRIGNTCMKHAVMLKLSLIHI